MEAHMSSILGEIEKAKRELEDATETLVELLKEHHEKKSEMINAQRLVGVLKSKLMTEAANATDNDGKKLYTNADSREAFVKNRLSTSKQQQERDQLAKETDYLDTRIQQAKYIYKTKKAILESFGFVLGK